jgi:type I restriction enzyme S subunit
MKVDGWEIANLEDVAEIFDGPHATPEKIDAGPWYLSISSLKDGHIDLSESAHISLEDFKVWTKRVLPRVGDVAFSYETRIGQAALIPEGLYCALGRRMGLLRFNTEIVDPRFAVYAYLGPIFQNIIRLHTVHGSTVDRIPLIEMGQFPFTVPPLSEQRKIAEILSTWDEAIAKTERLIAALRERKKGLMQRLLTGQVRFAGFEKSKEKQSTKFGEIPVDWGYVPIAEVAQHVSTKNNRGNDLPVLSCTKYDGLVDSLTYFGRQIFSEDTSTYKIVKREQFAYATNHIEEGSIGYQNLYDQALISPMYTVFETNGKIDDGFLYKLLKTELYRHTFEVNTSASVDRRGSLRWNVFAQIKIPLPSLPEQRAIAEMLDTCEQEIMLTNKQLDRLQQQKKGLMQRLLTGQVRVKV